MAPEHWLFVGGVALILLTVVAPVHRVITLSAKWTNLQGAIIASATGSPWPTKGSGGAGSSAKTQRDTDARACVDDVLRILEAMKDTTHILRGRTRTALAFALIGLLAWSVMWLLVFPSDEFHDIALALLGMLASLLAAVAGFYYGNQGVALPDGMKGRSVDLMQGGGPADPRETAMRLRSMAVNLEGAARDQVLQLASRFDAQLPNPT